MNVEPANPTQLAEDTQPVGVDQSQPPFYLSRTSVDVLTTETANRGEEGPEA